MCNPGKAIHRVTANQEPIQGLPTTAAQPRKTSGEAPAVQGPPIRLLPVHPKAGPHTAVRAVVLPTAGLRAAAQAGHTGLHPPAVAPDPVPAVVVRLHREEVIRLLHRGAVQDEGADQKRLFPHPVGKAYWFQI